ncbi:ubiquitin carboxyl-terminal hydrolase 18 [Euphorbia lathyris]|uniref:ubiquitin carboxyl-terminal hydrolase 18 n=1 Tax=Euphorbia lathyris TaxID=212925 RepID=UPI0033132CF6
MHVGGITVDLNWFLRFIFTLFLIALGLLHLVKNTASKYFEVDASFEGGGGTTDRNQSVVPSISMETCANCGDTGTKKCSRCKSVRYCSAKCQEAHWKSGHKSKCKEPTKVSLERNGKTNFGLRASGVGGRNFSGIALIPTSGTSKLTNKAKKVLFPYDEFIKLYYWDKASFPPCGLLNCGNSCFANVVLQCLTFTRPLAAYVLENNHQKECRRNDWCFLCEFQAHVDRASKSSNPFSPMRILSRLPNIGGNLGYGRQEDAHEFMRFAIDTMQSVCLDEFGGENAVDLASQETTLIQHVFGGHLQSQVICTKCDKVSNQLENMMDLTVEIHGDAASLEECLDQFTVKEWLHGENMYKCDGCNEYVKAWKRLTIRQPPNILTIALKRFQSGRFGKLNKRVTFPEILDLSPYTSEEGDGTDRYKLYAVVVHVDMLNASFFGHYICYIKDFSGDWYRVDDCKVRRVDLDEVLSQGAYMLLYSRSSARATCLRTMEPSEEQSLAKVKSDCSTNKKVECMNGEVKSINGEVEGMNGEIKSINGEVEGMNGEVKSINGEVEGMNGEIKSINGEVEGFSPPESMTMTAPIPSERNSEYANGCDVALSSAVSMDISFSEEDSSPRVDSRNTDNSHSPSILEVSNIDEDASAAIKSEADNGEDAESINALAVAQTEFEFESIPMEISGCEEEDSSSATDSKLIPIEELQNGENKSENQDLHS